MNVPTKNGIKEFRDCSDDEISPELQKVRDLLKEWDDFMSDKTVMKFMVLGVIVAVDCIPDNCVGYNDFANQIVALYETDKEYHQFYFGEKVFNLLVPDRTKVKPKALKRAEKCAKLLRKVLFEPERK